MKLYCLPGKAKPHQRGSRGTHSGVYRVHAKGLEVTFDVIVQRRSMRSATIRDRAGSTRVFLGNAANWIDALWFGGNSRNTALSKLISEELVNFGLKFRTRGTGIVIINIAVNKRGVRFPDKLKPVTQTIENERTVRVV